MTTPFTTSTIDSQMHNNIMSAGSRDRPPMLATGRYPQWKSHFLRYIDTGPNGDALRECILEGSYQPTTVTIPAVHATKNSSEQTVVETILTMSPKNKAHFESEKEAIHLPLTGIRDEIYSTVDAFMTTHEMWEAIERLQQDPYYQAPKSHKSYAPTSKASPPTRFLVTTRHKGKELAKPITPPSESASEEDSDTKQAQRDKDMQKNLPLIAKYFKKIYKPNNNLRTSSNFKNKNVDTTLRELVDQAWEKHSHNLFRAPTALDREVLIKTCSMPLAIKILHDSFTFVHELKQEMHADLKYVESLENEIDELESDKAEFSNMYDILLQEYYCCSNGSPVDKIICDLNKAPDSPHLHTFSSNQRHCFHCKDVLRDGEFCQRCTCMRCESGLSKGPCLICENNQNSLNNTPSISKNSSQSPPHINHNCCYECGDPLDGIFYKLCTGKSCGKGAHIGYNCPPKVLVISNPEPCKSQTIDELPQTLQSFHPTFYSGDESPFTYDSTPNIVDDSPNVFNPPPQPPKYSYEFCRNDAYYGYDCLPQDYTIVITPKELDNSLSMGDEHLDTIPTIESDEFIKSSVENLVPNPSESKGEHECDVPACDDFTTFSNLLFDVDVDFSSSDNESFFDEDISKKIYSNPLFGEEIISIKIDLHHFNVESDLIESMLNQDSLIISSSSKIDSLLDEFAGEVILLKSIPPGIDKSDCDSEEEIRLIEKSLYDNSSPRPSEEFNSENSDAIIESYSPSPILAEDSDPFMEEIDLFFTSNGSIPPGIDSAYSDSKGDNLFLERLLHEILFPFRTLLTSLMSSEFFFPSSLIR
nr:hypothetical protein [Tanacetum cinerariifolium]